MSAPAPSNRKWKIALIAAIVAGPLLGVFGTAWASHNFPDVPPTNIFHEEIEWGANNNIINGYTNGKFGPNDSVTRGQAAAFLSHYNDAIHTVSVTQNPPSDTAWQIEATCPLGERAIGGWGFISSSDSYNAGEQIVHSGQTFRIYFETENNAALNPSTLEATAVCVPYSVASGPVGNMVAPLEKVE